MAIRTIVTRGFGNGTFNGTIPLTVTRGYTIQPLSVAPPVYCHYLAIMSDADVVVSGVVSDSDAIVTSTLADSEVILAMMSDSDVVVISTLSDSDVPVSGTIEC